MAPRGRLGLDTGRQRSNGETGWEAERLLLRE